MTYAAGDRVEIDFRFLSPPRGTVTEVKNGRLLIDFDDDGLNYLSDCSNEYRQGWNPDAVRPETQ